MKEQASFEGLGGIGYLSGEEVFWVCLLQCANLVVHLVKIKL